MLLYVSLSLFLPFFSPSPCSLSFCHVSRKQPGENCPRFSDSLIIRRCGYVGKEEGVVGAGDLRRGFFFSFEECEGKLSAREGRVRI